jgi:hypothetical protein
MMKTTEIAVLELSKESATLMTAEGVFKFHFKKLRSRDSVLSNEQQKCEDGDGVSSNG